MPRTDVWAFGCVLVETLTGSATFAGDDVGDVLASLLKADPDWNKLPAGLHPRLLEVLDRCLRKDPNRRARDIGDVKLDIEALTQDPAGLRSVPVAVRTASVTMRLIAATGVIAVINLALLLLLAPSDTNSLPEWADGPIRFALYPPEGMTFGTERLHPEPRHAVEELC